MHPTDFSWALRMMREGRCLYRAAWRGLGSWVCLRQPDLDYPVKKGGLAHGDHLQIVHPPYPRGPKGQAGEVVPWVPTTADLLASDWDVVPEHVNDATEDDEDRLEVHMRIANGHPIVCERGERGSFLMRQVGSPLG